jgi:putative redox protein
MASIKASIGREHYATKIHSTTGNSLTADEPYETGGMNLGMNPGELFAASLASCTCITLRMYADRKEWPLESVDMVVDTDTDKETGVTTINKTITLNGPLDEEQKKRLLQIAEKCPINKMLNNPITLNTNAQ